MSLIDWIIAITIIALVSILAVFGLGESQTRLRAETEKCVAYELSQDPPPYCLKMWGINP